MNSILITKLVNGELLIGRTEQIGEQIKIRNPLQIGVINDGIAFIDFNGQLTDDKELVVLKDKVLYQYNAGLQITNAYVERTSGIVTPTVQTPGVRLSDLVS